MKAVSPLTDPGAEIEKALSHPIQSRPGKLLEKKPRNQKNSQRPSPSLTSLVLFLIGRSWNSRSRPQTVEASGIEKRILRSCRNRNASAEHPEEKIEMLGESVVKNISSWITTARNTGSLPTSERQKLEPKCFSQPLSQFGY